MEDKFMEVYSILYDVDRLIQDDYDYLVSKYGKEVVDLVISDLVNEDEDNFYRFQIDKTDNNVGLSSWNLYKNEVNAIPTLNAQKNYLLMSEIVEIVSELEKIFTLCECDDLKLKNGIKPWFEDKIFYCIDKCDDPIMLEKINNLFTKYVSIKNYLVEGNLRLVMSVANKYIVDCSTSFLEIVQYGNIGLMKAIMGYDINKGTAFSTYATYVIHKSIKDNIRNLKYPMKVSHRSVYTYHNILKVINNLSIQLGRTITYEDVAKYMNKTVLWVIDMMIPFVTPIFLDEKEEMDDDVVHDYCELIKDENAFVYDAVYDNYLRKELREILENNLTKKQFLVVMNYFGFYGQQHKLAEIASMLGISEQRTSQLKKLALNRLRERTNIMELVTE